MRKVMSLLLCFTFIFGVFTYIPSYCKAADYDNQIAPCYVYADNVDTSALAGSNQVIATSSVTGKPETTKITIKQTLQRYVDGSWTNGSSWTQSKSSISYTLQKAYSIVYSGTYRVKTEATVYCGSSYEVITNYSTSIYATYTP